MINLVGSVYVPLIRCDEIALYLRDFLPRNPQPPNHEENIRQIPINRGASYNIPNQHYSKAETLKHFGKKIGEKTS